MMSSLRIQVSIQMMLWGSFLRQSKNSIEMLILHGASSLAISRDKYFWSSGKNVLGVRNMRPKFVQTFTRKLRILLLVCLIKLVEIIANLAGFYRRIGKNYSCIGNMIQDLSR
nr:uncharacterized protein LOC112940436 [Solanum lycopersicum]